MRDRFYSKSNIRRINLGSTDERVQECRNRLDMLTIDQWLLALTLAYNDAEPGKRAQYALRAQGLIEEADATINHQLSAISHQQETSGGQRIADSGKLSIAS